MSNIKIFYLEESPYQPGKYTLRFNLDKFHCEQTNGSFMLMAARLLGLSYADYCRFCRDAFGAEIIGKGSMYPICYFKNTSEVQNLLQILNTRANIVLWEREHKEAVCI